MRLLVLLLFACTASGAETVVHNVTGYSPTLAGITKFSALAYAADGRVIATGGDELLQRFPAAQRVDGEGKTLLPGLTDAHAHVYGQGFLNVSLDLAGTTSVAAALRKIEAFANANPRTEWIQGRGWNQVLWPVQEFPTAADIDAVVRDRPVYLRRIDGHAGWVNSAALSIAGIDNETQDPIGGKILRDANGRATGVLIDKAQDQVKAHLPKPTMADDAELKLRIYAMLANAGANLDASGQPIVAHGNDMLDIRSVKIYVDGALGSRGAAMLEPYSDDAENLGLAFVTTEQLIVSVSKANDMGFQVGAHAIGDRGNRIVLDAFEQVQGGKPSAHRNRIEHAQIIALEDLPRLSDLGVIAAMQPVHATSDMNMAEDRIGSERIKGGYAWRTLLNSGAVIASGSDFPVELPNPFHGLYAAVARQDRSNQPAGGWYAEEAMTRAEALRSFTLDAAYAAHQEERLGSLETGKWADFIIVDRDYFEVPVEQIDDIEVLETWVAGRRVFQRNNGELQ